MNRKSNINNYMTKGCVCATPKKEQTMHCVQTTSIGQSFKGLELEVPSIMDDMSLLSTILIVGKMIYYALETMLERIIVGF